jgi:hypothetical protein
MHAVICSAMEYQSEQFQTFMDGEHASVYSQWIFDLIEKRFDKKKNKYLSTDLSGACVLISITDPT